MNQFAIIRILNSDDPSCPCRAHRVWKHQVPFGRTGAHQLESGVLVVRCPLLGLVVTLTWIGSGAFVPRRGAEPWLVSTVHIITLTAASTSHQQPPELRFDVRAERLKK